MQGRDGLHTPRQLGQGGGISGVTRCAHHGPRSDPEVDDGALTDLVGVTAADATGSAHHRLVQLPRVLATHGWPQAASAS